MLTSLQVKLVEGERYKWGYDKSWGYPCWTESTILYVPPEEPDLFSILQLDMNQPHSKTRSPRAAPTADASPTAAQSGAHRGPHRAARPMGSHDTSDADLSLESTITELKIRSRSTVSKEFKLPPAPQSGYADQILPASDETMRAS